VQHNPHSSKVLGLLNLREEDNVAVGCHVTVLCLAILVISPGIVTLLIACFTLKYCNSLGEHLAMRKHGPRMQKGAPGREVMPFAGGGL
jgi:hypothetical protein